VFYYHYRYRPGSSESPGWIKGGEFLDYEGIIVFRGAG
jgi:hypothetical protein